MLCRKADDEAWSTLVERYKGLVYSIPLRFRMPAEDAADVFQSVWLDLYSELERLRDPAVLARLAGIGGHDKSKVPLRSIQLRATLSAARDAHIPKQEP